MKICFLENVIFEREYHHAGEIIEVENAGDLIDGGYALPLQEEQKEQEVTKPVKSQKASKPTKAKAQKIEDAFASVPEVE